MPACNVVVAVSRAQDGGCIDCAGNGSLCGHATLRIGVITIPTTAPMQHPTSSQYTSGAFFGLAAVCIWASFIVVSRLGVKTSLSPWDVAAIRFSVAGLLL